MTKLETKSNKKLALSNKPEDQERFLTSTGYPLKCVADTFDVPYWAVLCYSDRIAAAASTTKYHDSQKNPWHNDAFAALSSHKKWNNISSLLHLQVDLFRRQQESAP